MKPLFLVTALRHPRRPIWSLCFFLLIFGLLAARSSATDKLWSGRKIDAGSAVHPNYIVEQTIDGQLQGRPEALPGRSGPFSLPKSSLAADYDTTINVLVLRYNFQYEATDDPNTTGRGVMNLSHPLADPADSAAYYDSVGHWIDPPPHDSLYFDAHMRALNIYWGFVSEGRYHLTWDIFPEGRDSIYTLPHPMSYYGGYPFDSVAYGLGLFFSDCMHIADADTNIHFSDYQAIVLFHAGSDRQNDLGFPPTHSDLFTGWIKFGDSIPVDGGAEFVRKAVIMPEFMSQDNRATAMNAVLAHEFGHQLGLYDMYNTHNFLSMLGDFALHDDNGFGTGIDFGFPVGKVFGVIPVYDDPWSRAYLGFDSIADFRQGQNIRIVATELPTTGLKIARVPISENEYYLIENRIPDIPGEQTFARVDSATNVILGPCDSARNFNGDYDYLIPGSGMLIYRVDEAVGYLKYVKNGTDNFNDNTLQWDPDRPFIKLIEADGETDFGTYYQKGYGNQGDVFRDDGKTSFTPNTNPPAFDHNGDNTHVYVTNIRRDSVVTPKGIIRQDSVMYFDLATDKRADGFPVRVGVPFFPLSIVEDDLDKSGGSEVIVASGRLLTAFTTDGKNYLRLKSGCQTCPVYADSAGSTIHQLAIGPQYPQYEHTVPLFAQTSGPITAGPVTTDFGIVASEKYVAVGYDSSVVPKGRVILYTLQDLDHDGQADTAGSIYCSGYPVALSGGDMLWVLCADGTLIRQTSLSGNVRDTFSVPGPLLNGICRVGSRLAVLWGDSTTTHVSVFGQDSSTIACDGDFSLGPIAVDVDRNGQPEIAAFSPDGEGIFITVDTTIGHPSLSVMLRSSTGYEFTTNPIAGDVDGDGYPDIEIGGIGHMYAFDKLFQLKSDFPIEINDKYPEARVSMSAVCSNVNHGPAPDLIFPTDNGSLYGFGTKPVSGFPFNTGGAEMGPPVVFADSVGGKLGYLGSDGWFYAWDVSPDNRTNFWPMGGHDPAGSFCFNQSQLAAPAQYKDMLPQKSIYNYPNPVTSGTTTIRYLLGETARTVTLTIFDMSGQIIRTLQGPTGQGDNEVPWNCGNVTPGVYRCMVKAEFASATKSGFVDIAVIR